MSDRKKASAADHTPKAASGTPVEQEFERHVLCHLNLVYRVALSLSRDPHEAEDLVQDTFLRAHRAFGRFELRDHGAKAWLLKILHNVFFSRREQAGRSPILFDEMGPDDFAITSGPEEVVPSTLGELNWEGFDEEVKEAVGALTPEHRSVVLLWALGDMSYKEIADVLGCAVGTVMSRLFRARQQLNRTLANYAQSRGIRRKADEGS